MLKKFLREVVTIIVGKHAEEIADLLNTKKHMNEFLIAKKLDLTVNQTRNILYKISDYGLISFIRKKDKKKGWYTYFWKIEILKSLEFLRGVIIKKIEQINSQVKSRESKVFYVCERCNIELNEENALLNDFTCNECGEVFTIKDNTKMLTELRKNLGKLERELSLLDEEIGKEREKLDKERMKIIKKEEKEKQKKRAAAIAKRKATRKSTAKKTAVKKKTQKQKKKVSKKKPVRKKTAKKKTKKKVVKKSSAKKKKTAVKKKAVKKKIRKR